MLKTLEGQLNKATENLISFFEDPSKFSTIPIELGEHGAYVRVKNLTSPCPNCGKKENWQANNTLKYCDINDTDLV